MAPGQEVSVVNGHFDLWSFMSELDKTLKLLLKMELKFPFNSPFWRVRNSAPDYGAIIRVTKLVWKVLGFHMEVIVNFAAGWWDGWFVNVWDDSGLGAFIASLFILMEILGFAWLELQLCWMGKNNPSLDQVSVCIYHQKSCLPIFPETQIV